MNGRHIEAATVEESRAFLAALNGKGPKRQPDYSAPVATAVDVVNERTVSFDGDRVPPNLSNAHLPNIRPRWQGPSRWSVTEDWREWVVAWGGAALVAAGWERAEIQQVARVSIVFYRVRRLDRDGAFSAAKPCLDGLKQWIGPRIQPGPDVWTEPRQGAGLIYDDDGWHLPDENYRVSQRKADHFHEQRTVVTVERLP